MTPDQFHDAISKGLGRIIGYLRTHSSEPYLDKIEHACTHNLAYDAQSETSRAEYLFEIIRLSGQIDRLAAGIVEVLRQSENVCDLWQAYELARRLAIAGYQDARTAMYERFDRSRQDPPEGMNAIVALDGKEGLLKIMRSLGRRILAGDHISVDSFLLFVAREHLGEDVRERVIVPAAQGDAEVRACLEALDKVSRDEQERSQRPARHRSLEGKSYRQVKEVLEARAGKALLGALRWWGKAAPDSEVIAAAQDALKETRPAFLLSYLRIFFYRPFPLQLDRLVQVANAGEEALARASLQALKVVRSPTVRAFGLDLLRRRHKLADAFGLFRLNYESGDHVFFMDALDWLSRSPDAETMHGAGTDLCDIFEKRIGPECRDPLLWVYKNTPCSLCRRHAVEILVEARQAPENLLRECVDDCDPRTRQLARAALGR